MTQHKRGSSKSNKISMDTFKNKLRTEVDKLILQYGHNKCGLMHKELCSGINSSISSVKNVFFKNKKNYEGHSFNEEWIRERRKFFDEIFHAHGFKNICFPRKLNSNLNINNLISNFILFCKKLDKDLEEAKKPGNYEKCKQYDTWINQQKSQFQHEFNKNVRELKINPVLNYFRSMKNSENFNPLHIYSSKINCEKIHNKEIKQEKIQSVPSSVSPKETKALENGKGSEEKKVLTVAKVEGEAKTKANLKESSSPNSSYDQTQRISTPNTQGNDSATSRVTYIDTKSTPPPVTVMSSKGSLPAQTHTHLSPIPATVSNSPQGPNEHKSSSSSPVLPSSTIPGILALPGPALSPRSPQGTFVTNPPEQTPGIPQSTQALPDLLPPSDKFPPSDPPVTEAKHKVPIQNVVSSSDVSKTPSVVTSPTLNTDTIAISSASSVIVSDPATDTKSTLPTGDPLVESQAPILDPSISSAPTLSTGITATIGTTTTKTTIAPGKADATPNMSTQQGPVFSTTEVSSISKPKDTNHEPSKNEHLGTLSPEGNQRSPSHSGKPGVTNTAIPAVTNSASAHTPSATIHMSDNNHEIFIKLIDSNKIPFVPEHPYNVSTLSSGTHGSGNSLNDGKVKEATILKKDITEKKDKNDNFNIAPEGLPSSISIIPTILIILTAFTVLFLLYKYTHFGLLLGRRRKKRKKKDLRKMFVIPEEAIYQSPYKTMHEWNNHNLGKQIMENDIQIKLLKIKRYKQTIKKKKKKKKTTLIEMHMEVLEEYKNDEWELHKGDFLEICLRGFINEKSDNYSKLPNTELTVKSTKNDKIIEDIQKQDILWNNWIEKHRNILEQWKEKEWFHILKNEWKKEQQIYKEKNDKLRENKLNEQEAHSIVSQKDMWKQWISKQAILIEKFNQEDWFKAMVYEQDKKKDYYGVNKYNENIIYTNISALQKKKTHHEHYKIKNIIEKLMVQMHMMILEECIKEEIIKNVELCIDNFIQDIHNQNNYNKK
ncbi:STP1 protein [Plasmodium ovale curtisi]|uniref:STP1 protein n=1 Tax=Plasmodium ovale curtisi TaxID=864141 RepID=A0A1A8WAX8_PLAOA|nr:STP1 protein [Plasmodium ovale curtisi]